MCHSIFYIPVIRILQVSLIKKKNRNFVAHVSVIFVLPLVFQIDPVLSAEVETVVKR